MKIARVSAKFGAVFCAVLLAVSVGLAVWAHVSLSPGAMALRYIGQNEREELTGLMKHYSPQRVDVRHDLQYRPDDPDARFDYYRSTIFPDGGTVPVIVWVHGGNWFAGDKTDMAPYFKQLAQLGYGVVVPNYSLAPDAAYPIQIRQINDVIGYLANQMNDLHIDAKRLVLAGEEAGATIAAQTAAAITNPKFADQIGIEPWIRPSQLKG